MVLHGFAWRNSKNTVSRPKTIKFDQQSQKIIRERIKKGFHCHLCKKPLWRKELDPIDVTPLGIVTEVSDLHPAKELDPIDVTPLWIVTEVSDLHWANKAYGIRVMVGGIVTEVRPEAMKAPCPMLALGIVTDVRAWQWAKAMCPMEVTELPIKTVVRARR